jgi:hypothetical protein
MGSFVLGHLLTAPLCPSHSPATQTLLCSVRWNNNVRSVVPMVVKDHEHEITAAHLTCSIHFRLRDRRELYLTCSFASLLACDVLRSPSVDRSR